MRSVGHDSSEGRLRPIAMLMPSLGGGGAQRVMLGLASGLTERGMAVDLVLVKAQGELLDLVPESVRLIDLNSHRAAASSRKFLRYIWRERPAVILSSLIQTNLLAMLAKLLLRKELRVIVRQESTFSEEFVEQSFTRRWSWRALKWLLPVADGVVAVSQGVADDLRGLRPAASHKITTIFNPVVWPDHAERAASPVEHPWFHAEGGPVIISVGGLAPVKDHGTLLKAFAQVVASRPAHLVILGEGPERRNLIALAERLGISQYLDMPGFHINPLAYMSKAKVFVLSSRREGLPAVLIEAMACGTPVVSTDCRSGPKEILEEGKWGRLVPVGDWRAMADAILETLDNPIPPDRLISRASAFSADASIDRHLEILTGNPN